MGRAGAYLQIKEKRLSPSIWGMTSAVMDSVQPNIQDSLNNWLINSMHITKQKRLVLMTLGVDTRFQRAVTTLKWKVFDENTLCFFVAAMIRNRISTLWERHLLTISVSRPVRVYRWSFSVVMATQGMFIAECHVCLLCCAVFVPLLVCLLPPFVPSPPVQSAPPTCVLLTFPPWCFWVCALPSLVPVHHDSCGTLSGSVPVFGLSVFPSLGLDLSTVRLVLSLDFWLIYDLSVLLLMKSATWTCPDCSLCCWVQTFCLCVWPKPWLLDFKESTDCFADKILLHRQTPPLSPEASYLPHYLSQLYCIPQPSIRVITLYWAALVILIPT